MKIIGFLNMEEAIMKRTIILFGLCATLVGVARANPTDSRMSFGFFYSSLAPHGEWIEADAGYYVWRPYHVGHGWHPYMEGRWVWTDYGWYWVSYEPYGWAVFHYGRWYYDDFYGWVWVPGYEWGPAWVEWRYNDDYIGWAPLPPYATFNVSIGIRFTRTWFAPAHYWTFVGCRYFTEPRVVQYVVPVERTGRFFGSTRTASRYDVDNGRVVNRGVDVGFVEQRGNTRVERLNVVETRERGQERVAQHEGRERVEIYRPDREEVKQATPQRIEARRPERRLSSDWWSTERKDTRQPKENRGEQFEHRDARVKPDMSKRERERRDFQPTPERRSSAPQRFEKRREEPGGRPEPRDQKGERRPEEQRRGRR